MKTLTPVAKVWYNFLSAKLKPNLHLSMVTRDKTILLYVINQGIKFDVGHVIHRGIIESTHGHCTGALIRLSLITQLCQNAKVSMLETKEKVHHRLPLSMPKAKDGAQDNVKDDDEGNVAENREEDSEDGDSEVDLPNALRSAFSRLSTRQDELAHRQQLQVGHLEQNIAYMVSMMHFYHEAASSSVVPPQPPPVDPHFFNVRPHSMGETRFLFC